MEQTDTKGESKCGRTKNDDEDELQYLKRIIAEKNRVQQESEIKFHQMKHMLNKELKKSQLLEIQLTENYKKVRMLNIGSTSLDHILSMGQSPKINWSLGYQGSTSQQYDEAGRIRSIKAKVKSDEKPKAEEKSESMTKTKENQNTACGNRGLFSGKRGHHETNSQTVDKIEKTKVVKRLVPVFSAVRKDETKAKIVIPKIQDIKVVAKRKNGCHFCGKIGHSVGFCYSRRNQIERA